MTTETLEPNNGTSVESESSLAVSDKKPSHLMYPQINLPGHRPIERSHLKVISTYTSVGSQRPVTASEMQVSSSMTISGNRPIGVSTLKISDSFAISGNRPVSLSVLNISSTYSIMGGRPVASNEIDDDVYVLMGYID